MRIYTPLPLAPCQSARPRWRHIPLPAHFGLAGRFAVMDSLSDDIVGERGMPGLRPLPNLADCEIDAQAGPAADLRLLRMSWHAGQPVPALSTSTVGDIRRELRDIFRDKQTRQISAAICATSTRCRPIGDKT